MSFMDKLKESTSMKHFSKKLIFFIFLANHISYALTRDEIANLGYMHPGRVDVITAGALVLSRVIAATGATEFVASESDILDGIAWKLAGE